MALVATFLLSPNHSVWGSLAHCSVRLACCSASFCLPWSAIALPWSATCLRRSFQLSFPPAAGASAAGAAGGGGGANAGAGGGYGAVTGSIPVIPWSETCSVQAVPSQYRSSCVPPGSGSQLASAIAPPPSPRRGREDASDGTDRRDLRSRQCRWSAGAGGPPAGRPPGRTARPGLPLVAAV